MAIPKIKHPEYRHFAHGIQKEIRFRPFTNAEQKILLLAKNESEDQSERLIEAVEQVLHNCILDDIDIEQLCMFDIEEIFIRIRAKSVGEIVTPKFSYQYTDKETGQEKTDFVKLNINLDEVKLSVDENATDTFMLDEKDGVGIKLRYPAFKDVKQLGDSKDDIEMLKRCIVCAFDKDEVYDAEQMTDDEKEQLVSSFPIKMMKDVSEFFNNMPSMKHTIDVKLPKLGETETITMKGIRDFFI